MKFLITGGMGVNGAVAARLMVRDGLRPLLMDNRVDYTLINTATPLDYALFKYLSARQRLSRVR